jgi:membrane protein implicated in regulation of membrane protease activity
MVILEFISAVLLIVYVIAEKRYLPTVYFEILFVFLGIALAVLSYLYDSIASLAISSIVSLLALIRIVRVTKLVKPRPENKSNKKGS